MTFALERIIILCMKSQNQHVVLHEGKWAIKCEGSRRVTAVYETKQEAIDAAQKAARDSQTKVVIHGRSGQILQRSEAPSTLNEERIRQAVRALAQESESLQAPRSRSAIKKVINKTSH